MLTSVIIALGYNLGDPGTNLDEAIRKIEVLIDQPVEPSSYWMSAPQDMAVSAPHFLNAVLKGQTHLSAFDLLRGLQDIESNMGRVREPSAGKEEPSAGARIHDFR